MTDTHAYKIELSGKAVSVMAILRAAPVGVGQLIEFFPEQSLEELAELLEVLASHDLVTFDTATGNWLCSCRGLKLLQSNKVVVWIDSPTNK